MARSALRTWLVSATEPSRLLDLADAFPRARPRLTDDLRLLL